MHKVIENFAPKELHQHIKDIMSSDNFAWFYHDFVADYYDKTADEFYFTHTFYSDKTKEVNSNWYNDIIHPILFVLIGKDYDLIRAKANLFTKTSEPVKYGFHTDYKFDKHTTLVYSVNTNNGYTEFKDGTKIPSIENSS